MKKENYLIGAAIGVALLYAYMQSKTAAPEPPIKQAPGLPPITTLPNPKSQKTKGYPTAIGRGRRHIGVRPWDGPWGAARAMHV